ncbi:MAG: biotin--[acetyl-CoA-carboxylase] ligase [Thermodesulfobacterium geofontis]|uniref:Bifunctional ligase/repressor BirA n=1 Tax=Thermodesulfobacterium geofontis TaxID=1295609 RepID=A0A2N7Q5X5_9BACT|nr:MAG: biotin--[acetyl-CoA-carboxylase] ligase [Thermodesulfobacterium geofontis]PMP93495.1 MAG: biotin--[acetyl-CoA-carboxylase] ligase [Thermodesulfobacterium geofontis]
MNKSKTTKSKIIELLKANDIISGEEIGKILNISRTAVWKHIQDLKKKGYQIETLAKGYRLINNLDLLNEEELSDLPYKVYYFKEITSTMDVAKDIAEKEESAIIIAETQTKGRGRLNRIWHSPKGGIWMSLIVKPSLSLKEAFLLTYTASLATALALEKIARIRVYLKWPNDVIYRNDNEEKKLAGILLEVKAEIDKIKYAIIGIGINVNNEISSVEPQAISLKEILNREIKRKDIIKALVENFRYLIKKEPKEILNAWKEKSLTLGRKVKIIHPEGEKIGFALDISDEGALILKTEKNEILKIYSGDCIHLRSIS